MDEKAPLIEGVFSKPDNQVQVILKKLPIFLSPQRTRIQCTLLDRQDGQLRSKSDW